MLNDAAKKLVARSAQEAVREGRERVRLGASIDQVVAEAWDTALIAQPDFRDWPSAKAYFETVAIRKLAER